MVLVGSIVFCVYDVWESCNSTEPCVACYSFVLASDVVITGASSSEFVGLHCVGDMNSDE